MNEINNESWHIGHVTIPGRVGLAPMAGFSDVSYRLLAKEMGASFVCTEMVSAMGIKYNNEHTKDLLYMEDVEQPVSMQIFGSDPEAIAIGAKVVEAAGAPIVDINMGCPVKKVVSSGDGSALMKTPELAMKVAEAAVRAVQIPVTVKLRLGWDDSSINVVDMAQRMESVGVAAVAVHGRTREQMYSGKANWDYIKQVKAALSIPVIGNGDVHSPESAKAMLEYTGCDAVLVGRAAQGNPWLFKQIKEYLETGTYSLNPTGPERIDMLLRHYNLLCQYKGIELATREIRTHASFYIKGMPEAARWRNDLNVAMGRDSFIKVVESYRNFLEERTGYIL